MYCYSALGYVSQFAALNASVRHAEHRALQSLVRGPWQRIPTWLLKNLTVLGVPIRAPDLESMARAAAFRCAATSDVFFTARQMVEGDNDDPDALMVPRDDGWFGSCSLAHLMRNFDAILRIPQLPTMADHTAIQKALTAFLRTEANMNDVIDLVHRRTKKIAGDHIQGDTAAHMVRYVVEMFGAFPPFVGLCVLRTLCNCWATLDHYNEAIGCRLCGRPDVWEGILHLITCSVGNAILNAFGVPPFVGTASDAYVSLLGGNGDWGGQMGARKAVALDVLYCTFNTIRHQPARAGNTYNFAVDIANARRRTLASIDGRIHAIIAVSNVIE